MDHNEPVWFLLPSAIIKRLEDKTSQERQLPPNMISTVLARIRANPGRERELLEMARRIRQYVQDFPRGWGKWPNDINEALFVGLILGVWFSADIDEQIAELPEEALAALESECRENGVSTEQCLFDRLVEDREGED